MATETVFSEHGYRSVIQDTRVAPADWAAIVFGQYDALAHRTDGVLVSSDDPGTLVDGHIEHIGPVAPLLRTHGDYHQCFMDIVLGQPQPDSSTYMSLRYLRENALLIGRPGITYGIAQLAWLDVFPTPTDFDAAELAAVAAAEGYFTRGQPLSLVGDGTLTAPELLWLRELASPLAKPYSWENPKQLPHANNPVSIIVFVTASGALTIERTSTTILAAARALSVKELPVWAVFV